MDNNRMNYLFHVMAIALTLTLMGCQRRTPVYDARLVGADSLLCSNLPDSALGMLTSINGIMLPSARDRAYHALLQTQAQYRCYVDITSDSTINVALDYYKHHSQEHEKLTRSYIYKGAVTEVQGDPDAAMTYYKQAAIVAAPEDHFNLGYANLRIGSLYRDYLAADTSDVTFVKKALYHFEQVPDSFYILTCLSTIGGAYSAREQRDSAIFYLERAEAMAIAMHQTAWEHTTLIYLADMKMFSPDTRDIEKAKDIALKLLADEQSLQDRHDHLLLVAAFTLAKLNKADSASHYLNLADKDKLSDGLRVLYNLSQAELARCHRDISKYQDYYERATVLSDSLKTNATQRQLREVEAKYDNEVLKNKALAYRHKWAVSLSGAVIFIGALTAVIMALRRRLKQRQLQVMELEETIERLHNDTALLASQLDAHHAMSDDLKQAIRHQIEVYCQLVEKHALHMANSPGKFSKAFEQSYRTSAPDSAFWATLRAYADNQYNNIITQSIANYPALIDTDIHYLTLYCCGLSNSVIMACLGYNEAHSVYNKKRRVAELVGFPNSLDAYIQLFSQGCEHNCNKCDKTR